MYSLSLFFFGIWLKMNALVKKLFSLKSFRFFCFLVGWGGLLVFRKQPLHFEPGAWGHTWTPRVAVGILEDDFTFEVSNLLRALRRIVERAARPVVEG